MPTYNVIIPYYHRFTVVADNEVDAITKAHDTEGTIISYDDDQAEVVELYLERS